MVRKWLAGVAIATIAGTLPACTSALTDLSGTSATKQTAAISENGSTGTDTSTTLGADDQAAVPFTDDAFELDALLSALEDPEVLELIGADPLINDGGAVFLEDGGSSGYRLASQSSNAPAKPPLWKRLGLKAVGGKYDDGLRCADPEKADTSKPAGFRSLCFDKAAGLADVTVAQRVRGKFVIDVPPYSNNPFKGVLLDDPRLSIGVKGMDLLAVSHAKFQRTRTRWRLQGASTTQVRMVDSASQSVRITSVDLVSDSVSQLAVQSPANVVARQNLKKMPRSKQLIARAKVSSEAGAMVFIEDAGKGIPGILRLFDDGLSMHGDETAGDGVFSNRLNTPAMQRLVHRVSVHAFSLAMMGNEDKEDYDADTWIIPMGVE